MIDPFEVPPYPYDRLGPIRELAAAHRGGPVDLSVGTPTDPPPDRVIDAFGSSGAERSYPPSIGSERYRDAAAGWLHRRVGVDVEPGALAACVGTKEFVTSLPHLLSLRRPDLDTVLYPAVSYPSYAMGAQLAGCRPVPVAPRPDGTLDLTTVDPLDAARALCLWINTPANPTGALEDIDAARTWARDNGVVLVSDECYIEFTWAGPPRTVIDTDNRGVLAVHSLSKRSNLAGARAGFYAGDPDLVRYVSEIRKHMGLMVPGPAQAAAVAAWGDDSHVDAQRDRYHGRLSRMVGILDRVGVDAHLPEGAFYLWVATSGDDWGFAARLAERLGVVVSPGEFYGPAGVGHVRMAMVACDDHMDLVEERADAVASGVSW